MQDLTAEVRVNQILELEVKQILGEAKIQGRLVKVIQI